MAAPASGTPPFAFLWNNNLLSDYKLLITRLERIETPSPDVRASKRRRLFSIFSSQDSAKPDDQPRMIDVHGAVLTAASQHFKSIIENLPQDERTLHLQEPSENHEALRQLIKFCYIWALDDDMAQLTLVKLMLLADKYAVSSCLQACAQRFHGLAPQQLQWEAVEHLFQLPPQLRASEAFAGVVQKAKDKLFSAFTPLETAWNSVELRAAFLQLPFAALELLLGSTQLQVVSENAVLVAAASWLVHDRSRAGRSQGVFPLLRLQHLSQSFLGDVLPRLAPLAGLLTVQDCLRIAQYSAAGVDVRLRLHQQQPSCRLMLPPRAVAQAHTIGVEIVLQAEEVRAAQQRSLLALMAEQAGLAPPSSEEEAQQQPAPSSTRSGETLYASPTCGPQGQDLQEEELRSSEQLWSSSFCTNGFTCELRALVASSAPLGGEPSSRLVLELQACAQVGDALLPVPSATLSLEAELTGAGGCLMCWSEESLEEASPGSGQRVLQQAICAVAGVDEVVEGSSTELAQLAGPGGELKLRVAVRAS